MNVDVSRRERFKALAGALALAVIVVVLAPPAVEAATQTVRVKGKVKIADSLGATIESEPIAPMGILQAEGSDGALAVRTFAGGGGFLAAGDCTTTQADGLSNAVDVSNVIVTGIIMTGTGGRITVTSQAVGGGQLPLLRFRVNADNPNEFIGLGNGLTVTAPLTFTCTAEDGGEGNANFVLLGQ